MGLDLDDLLAAEGLDPQEWEAERAVTWKGGKAQKVEIRLRRRDEESDVRKFVTFVDRVTAEDFRKTIGGS